MSAPPLITLLTDFGLEDPYVGVMKGALLRHCPDARLVDLSHALAAGDRVAAAFWIERVFRWFEPGTVHLVVVDPGVGSARVPLAVRAHSQYFVGPDNGVLSEVIESDAASELRVIESGALPSRTFHGRDLFAPTAARLAAGSLGWAEVGPLTEERHATLVPRPVAGEERCSGQVITVDRFGNALTNLGPPPAATCELVLAGRRFPLLGTYADAAPGGICALLGSFERLEIAQRDGHAARTLGITAGTPVELAWGARLGHDES